MGEAVKVNARKLTYTKFIFSFFTHSMVEGMASLAVVSDILRHFYRVMCFDAHCFGASGTLYRSFGCFMICTVCSATLVL